MAEHQHTPAPWQAVSEGDEVVLVEALTPDGQLVTREICNVFDGGTPEDGANLKLIAASPDLLAALEDVVEMAQDWADGKSRSHPDHDRVAAARAAIAKAVSRG